MGSWQASRRSTLAPPAGPLLGGVGGGRWEPLGVVASPHRWGAAVCRGRPQGAGAEEGGRGGGGGCRKPQAQRGEEGRQAGGGGAAGPSHHVPAPADHQVSPTSPSKPTLPRWRTKCPCRRAKPSMSFTSCWMAGGSSGRRAPLPPHCAHPECQPWPGAGPVWGPCPLGCVTLGKPLSVSGLSLHFGGRPGIIPPRPSFGVQCPCLSGDFFSFETWGHLAIY